MQQHIAAHIGDGLGQWQLFRAGLNAVLREAALLNSTIAQVKLFNDHPTGRVLKEERLRALAGDGGIQECGFAQNCVEVCPKGIPLTNAISDMSRDVLIQKAKDFLRG